MNKRKSYQWHLENVKTETWVYHKTAFASEEIEKIIESGNKEDIMEAAFNGAPTKNTRSTNVSWIPSSDKDNEWLFQRLTDIINLNNKKFFNYDITTIETLQYSIYHEGGFYKDHIDISNISSMGVRKLSFSVMLTDPEEYEGGELLLKISSSPIITPNKKGDIILFPSYVLHEVTPVTKGTRKTLVGWVLGPGFK